MSPSQAGKTAVLQNIHGLMEFLGKHPPFRQMDSADLAWLLEHCQLRFYAAGEPIIRPQDGPVQHFHIVKQGRVIGERREPDGSPQTTFEITAGECFPIAALLGERATRTEHRAAEDCFCLLLGKPAFVELFTRSAVFRDFALRGISSLLDQVNQQVQLRAAENLGAQYSLNTPLQALAGPSPLSCSAETPLREAVRQMHERHVGSMVIADPGQRPLGIFTLRDLRRVVADGLDSSLPIGQLMTADPFHLPPSATAFDAVLAMAERHIAHVCLVDQGRLVGVISERDLFALQRVDLVHLARAIRHAADLPALLALRGDIRLLVERMLAHGASSTQITRLITQLNDHSMCRVIELACAELGDPGVPFSWLCFGSEGRCEQTLHTDQDNGILFEADSPQQAEAIRQRLLPLARRINLMLAECGFSLCRGNIMAGNPQLCLSAQEWRQRFAAFVREASPDSLLASSIYFDLRVLWGAEQGVQHLRRQLHLDIADNRLFQRQMAANALRHRPPLGRFRDFVLARKGAEKDTLDLKEEGLTPFVDAARLLALAHAVDDSNTLARLAALVRLGVLDAQDGSAYEEAYQFIQQTRLQLHQRLAEQGLPLHNRLDPDRLNPLDRRILRESFRQAQRLQASLSLRYQL